METTHEDIRQVTLIGRSSSHFTRVAKIFARELGVVHSFQVVPNLLSSDPNDYGGHPALKVPTLRTPHGAWFGALNICRELSRQSRLGRRIVWPEALDQPLLANAQELTVQAMATEVALIMGKLAAGATGHEPSPKMQQSLVDTLAWLDARVAAVVSALPADRDLSYLEVTLFCLVTHLEFREIVPAARYSALNDFCRGFAERASAVETTYRFDS